MNETPVTRIRELRRRTGAGLTQCKSTLERTNGDVDQAVEQLRVLGMTGSAERASRRTNDGVIASYIHHNGKLGVLVEVNCETDFVARTDAFSTLVGQLAEHIAGAAPIAVSRDTVPPELVEERRRAFEREVRIAGKPEYLAAKIVDGKLEAYFRAVILMDQAWVREPKISVGELVKQVSSLTGENIQVRRFARFHMGTA